MADQTVVPDIRPDILDRDYLVWFGVFLAGEVIKLFPNQFSINTKII